MTDPKKPALDDLLSNFALGPSWARAKDETKSSRKPEKSKTFDQRERRDDRGGNRDDRGGRFDKGRRPFKGGDDKFADRRPDTPPAPGVRVTINPAAAAVHLIVKEVQHVARCYPLFDIASTLLAQRERCRAIFESDPSKPPLFKGKVDDSLFLTREDASRHLWHSELKTRFLDEETIEVEAPAGNFQSVAKCGLSGEWLGPPNFHTYQTQLHRLHRERYSHMPFDAYASKVRTERGEEAIQAWLDTMKQKTRWRLKGQDGDDAWIDDRALAERALATHAFDQAFEETRQADLLASASGHQLSPQLRVSLKLAYNHARKHAAMLIPAVCKAIEAEHMPVFKRKGKLFTGPVRPHPLPANATLATRPAQMIDWIRANPPAKLEGLWNAVLPEGSTAPPADYAADLFWLLQQGHILLFTDDTLVIQEAREGQAPKPEGSGKKKKKKGKPAQAAAPEATAKPTAEATAEPTAEATVEPIAEATAEPTAEATVEPIADAVAEAAPVEVESVPEVVAEMPSEACADPTPGAEPEAPESLKSPPEAEVVTDLKSPEETSPSESDEPPTA